MRFKIFSVLAILQCFSVLPAKAIDVASYLDLSTPEERPDLSERQVVGLYIDCMLAVGALKLIDDLEDGTKMTRIDMEYAFQGCQPIAQELYKIKYFEIQQRNEEASFATVVNNVMEYFRYVHSRIEELTQ